MSISIRPSSLIDCLEGKYGAAGKAVGKAKMEEIW